MNRWRCFEFRPLDISWNGDGVWWVSIMSLRFRDWEGDLLSVEYDMGRWRFDILYSRQAVQAIRNWWEG